MNNLIRFLALTTILSLLAGRTHAQQTNPTDKFTKAGEHTDDRGLLLGMYFPAAGENWNSLQDGKWVPEISDAPHGQYLTFWVSKGGDSVKIQMISGLLVPRDSGFWRIGSQVVKSTKAPESNYDEQFWAAPILDKPQMPETDTGIDGKSVRLLTYIGTEYISYSFHWQGGAGDWEYVYPHVAAIDTLTKDKTVEQVLGPAISTSYKRKAKALDHVNEEHQNEPCGCCTGSEDEWGITHVRDHWQVFARFHYGTSSSCAQGSMDEVLATTLQKRLAAGGTLGRPWEVLRQEAEALMKTEPGSVQHLFVSPRLDLLVALGTHGLAVLGVENLHLRSVLKGQEFDAASIPVMEQWSLGRFVSGWDAVIQKEQPAEIPNTENP
jgi:hypothetical protein